MTGTRALQEHRAVEEAVATAVIDHLSSYLEQFHTPPVIARSGNLEIVGRVNEDDPARTLVLKVDYTHEGQVAEIPNITMPEFMKHQRLGKATIAVVRDTLSQFGYRLLVIDMVPSFFYRLVARGATILEHEESVHITDETELTGPAPSEPDAASF